MVHAFTLSAVLLAQAAADVSEADLSAQVDQLVRQLNDDSLQQRQAAEKELVELGAVALQLLPSPNDRMPQEMKLRLGRVREQLENLTAKASADPALVTLKGEMELSAIIEQLSEQSGNRIVDFRNQFGQASSNPTINMDFEEAPFWEVMDYVLDQANLKTYAYSGQLRTLAFVQQDENDAPAQDRVAYAGLFRVDPMQVRAVRNLRNPSNQSLSLSLEISWEPRILPILISQPLNSMTIIDDAGNELSVRPGREVIQTSVQNTVSSVELDVPLELPSRDVERIASLKGEVSALLPGRETTFTFDDLDRARNVEKSNAGVTVVLQRIRKNGEIQQVRILIQFEEASGALESHRGWIYGNEALMLGADGKEVKPASFETTRQQPSEVGLAYNFVLSDELANYRFTYKTPAAIVQRTVPYELQDIPLP